MTPEDIVRTPTPPGHWNLIAVPFIQQFEAQKEEASISRLYGGIHYRSDLEVGKAHGKRVGGYTVAFARTDGAQ